MSGVFITQGRLPLPLGREKAERLPQLQVDPALSVSCEGSREKLGKEALNHSEKFRSFVTIK